MRAAEIDCRRAERGGGTIVQYTPKVRMKYTPKLRMKYTPKVRMKYTTKLRMQYAQTQESI